MPVVCVIHTAEPVSNDHCREYRAGQWPEVVANGRMICCSPRSGVYNCILCESLLRQTTAGEEARCGVLGCVLKISIFLLQFSHRAVHTVKPILGGHRCRNVRVNNRRCSLMTTYGSHKSDFGQALIRNV